MLMVAGFPINWGLTSEGLKTHPLYIKYSSSVFDDIDAAEVKADLGQVLATAQSAQVCAYLSWLLRSKALLA